MMKGNQADADVTALHALHMQPFTTTRQETEPSKAVQLAWLEATCLSRKQHLRMRLCMKSKLALTLLSGDGAALHAAVTLCKTEYSGAVFSDLPLTELQQCPDLHSMQL